MVKASKGWFSTKTDRVEDWQCTEQFFSGELYDIRGHRCGKRAKFDLDEGGNPTKCKLHSQDGKAERAQKAEDKYQAGMAKRIRDAELKKLSAEAQGIVRKIAEGHNDPRSLCLDWVKRMDDAK